MTPSSDLTPPGQALKSLERRYSLVIALGWFATILPGAVIVLYAQSRGLSLAGIGLYGAVYGITAALLELPTGNLADEVGRKRVALWSYALSALAQLVLLFAFSLPAFLVYAVVGGLARALGSGALAAWFISSLKALDPEINLQPSLARVNTVELLALGLGSLGGAGLAAGLTVVAPDGLWGQSPLAAAIVAALLMHLLTLGVAWKVIQESARSHRSVAASLRAGLLGLPTALRDAGQAIRLSPLLPWLLGLEVLTGLMPAASETYWQPFFSERFGLGGTATVVFGVLLAGCFLAGMLGNLSAGPLLRVFGERVSRLGVVTQIMQAGALVALAWQGSVWLAAGLLWLTYFARSAFSSSFTALYNGQVAEERRSLMLSVLSVAVFVGFSVGNIALGLISTRWSVSWAWTLVAGVLLLSLPAFSKLGQTHSMGKAMPQSPEVTPENEATRR